MVRQDKFKVGDRITLTPEGHYKETALSMKKNNHGRYDWLTDDGIYTITAIEEIGDDNHAVGHTQLLRLKEDYISSGRPRWSGAYWKLVKRPNTVETSNGEG